MDATAFPTNITFIVAARESQQPGDAGPMDVRDEQTSHVVLTVEVAQ